MRRSGFLSGTLALCWRQPRGVAFDAMRTQDPTHVLRCVVDDPRNRRRPELARPEYVRDLVSQVPALAFYCPLGSLKGSQSTNQTRLQALRLRVNSPRHGVDGLTREGPYCHTPYSRGTCVRMSMCRTLGIVISGHACADRSAQHQIGGATA